MDLRSRKEEVIVSLEEGIRTLQNYITKINNASSDAELIGIIMLMTQEVESFGRPRNKNQGPTG